MKKVYEGWLGVNYEDTGFYDSQQNAQRCYLPDITIFEFLEDFDTKKIKIIIEEIE